MQRIPSRIRTIFKRSQKFEIWLETKVLRNEREFPKIVLKKRIQVRL